MEEVTEVRTPVEEEEMSGDLFCTAVSEEKLQEACQKSRRRIFGSSKTFLALDVKPHRPNSYEDIVQEKMTEHYERGLHCLSQEEWEKAVISFTKAINLCPEKIELYVQRAEAFLQLGDFQSAAVNLQKACADPNPPLEHIELLAATYYLQGQNLFDQMCPMDAMECFTRAAELQPQNRHYHMRSICCLAALGRYSECLRLMNKQLEEEQDNPDLYIVRARLYDNLNKNTMTYQDIQRALSLDPQHQEALKMKDKLAAKAEEAKDKAVNYAVQGQLPDALKKICYAIENHPSSARYHIFRGIVYRKMKDFSPAVDDFVRAMQLCNAESGPDCQDMQLHTEAETQLLLTYNDFAVHCYKRGFYQDGAMLLNKALKGEKNKKELYINRGDCFFQLGDLTFALADYQQAFELDDGDWGVRTRLAKLLDDLGLQAHHTRQYQQAELHFSAAIKMNPLLPQLYLHRAQLKRQLQNHTDSQEDAITSILLNSKSDEVSPTVMNFFPGKSLEEVLNSTLATRAHHQLEKSLKKLPTEWEGNTLSIGHGKGMHPETKRDIAVCMSDQQLREMVQNHRQLKKEMRAALHRRGRLQSTAVQIGRPPQLQPEEPNTHAPYCWKTFGLGLTNPG
ncbi:PREDICTED: tetratricopeptide repeat protein 16 [Nanorana parkeri]|uniref:tetratricopeptide repeat protein 16 n=1 Tax=Nanorana parkeri TaxID=125878 RepID=UPI000854FF58|nr:PREDICTED: tetratricopeptide repeat protein 16 [Nanorana parkeri]